MIGTYCRRVICLTFSIFSLLIPACNPTRQITSQTKVKFELDLVLLKGSWESSEGKYLRGLFYTNPFVYEPVLYHWKYSPSAENLRNEIWQGETVLRIMQDGTVTESRTQVSKDLKNLLSRKIKTNFPDFEFPLRGIKWTQDGRGIIIHTASSKNYRYVSRLYYMRKDLTARIKIYDSGPGGAHLRAIQDDENSKMVYFLETSGPAKGLAVRRASIAGGKVETLKVFGNVGHIKGLQLSPDKKHLGFILQTGRDTGNQPGSLWYMKRNGKDLRDLLKFPSYKKLTGPLGKYSAYKGVREFRWSPDGKSLVYTAALKGDCKGRKNFIAGGLFNVKCSYSLYRIDLKSKRTRKILTNINRLKLIHWLPKSSQ